jgi:hypothetical protein
MDMRKFYKNSEIIILALFILIEIISLAYFIKMKYLFLVPIYQILFFGSNQTGFIINVIILLLLTAIPIIGILIFKKEMFFFHLVFLSIIFLYIVMFVITNNNLKLLEQALKFFG